MPNICFIDPGLDTGIALFSPFGDFIDCFTVRDVGRLSEYEKQLELFKARHDVNVAGIEDYVNFGKHRVNAGKVLQQIRVCQDVFREAFFMIQTVQWNSRSYKESFKKAWAVELFRREFKNGHMRDASLMGSQVFHYIKVNMKKPPIVFIKEIAETTHKFPNRKALSRMIYEEILSGACR